MNCVAYNKRKKNWTFHVRYRNSRFLFGKETFHFLLSIPELVKIGNNKESTEFPYRNEASSVYNSVTLTCK